MYLKATTWAMVGLVKAKEGVQSAVKKFFQNEQGDTNMISIIIILVIVVGLAIVFRKNIATIANNLWNKIATDAGSATGTEFTTGGNPSTTIEKFE